MVWPRTIGTTFEERGRRLTGPNKNAAVCYRKAFGYSFGLGNRKCGERPLEAVEQSKPLVSCPINTMAFVAIKMGRRQGEAMLFMGQDTRFLPSAISDSSTCFLACCCRGSVDQTGNLYLIGDRLGRAQL